MKTIITNLKIVEFGLLLSREEDTLAIRDNNLDFIKRVLYRTHIILIL